LPLEVELKLDLAPEAADALGASTLLPGAARKVKQHALYFDTPAHALRRNGLSLRIRKSGTKRVQTVKADNAKAAGLYARPEWEMPVKNDTPIVDDRTPITMLLGEGVSTIAPIFEVKIERHIWVIEEGGAQIELALDRGTAIAGERHAPICEVELELISGPPQALFDFARRIDAIAPARLGVLTKSGRGYTLLELRSSTFKAEPVSLDHTMTVAQSFQTIAQNAIHHYRLNEVVLLNAREPEALHQARVALRRLRSAISIFKALLDASQTAHFKAELQWLAAILGRARNLDVIVKRLKPGPLYDRIDAARSHAYAAVEEVLAAKRVRTLMLDLAQWLAEAPWSSAPETADMSNKPIGHVAVDILNRLRKRVRQNAANIEQMEDEARHQLRKDAKRLRYAADFFVGVFNSAKQRRRHRKFGKALERLQDQLGALNDLAMAPAVLAELGLTRDKEAMSLIKGSRKGKLLTTAAKAHDDLVDTKKFWL
jgi:inorganic triphosphatase YgiF